jgi:hypothetical protein
VLEYTRARGIPSVLLLLEKIGFFSSIVRLQPEQFILVLGISKTRSSTPIVIGYPDRVHTSRTVQGGRGVRRGNDSEWNMSLSDDAMVRDASCIMR